MVRRHIHEGTPQELAPFLAQRPQGRFRLIELEADGAQAPNETAPEIDAESAAALALLEAWLEEDAAEDPEEIRKSEEEYEELKRNLNANRAGAEEDLSFLA